MVSSSDWPSEGRIDSLRAADGYLLRYRVWTPATAPRATLVLLNGVMSHSLWFGPLVPLLLEQGFKIVGADRRGTGVSTEARGDVPGSEALIDDARAIIDKERVPERPLHLVGWCWGAVLALNVAGALPERPASLILLAPGLFPTEVLKQRMAEQELLARERPKDEPCLRSPILEEMFTSGPALEGFIAKDPHRLVSYSPRFQDAMAKLGFGARRALSRLDLPLLVVLARDDQATDNAETERGFARLAGGRAAIEVLDGAHGLQFDAPEALARAVGVFAARSGGGAAS
jgi:alpha-beta hydrolase superfamily lysophospholipase